LLGTPDLGKKGRKDACHSIRTPGGRARGGGGHLHREQGGGGTGFDRTLTIRQEHVGKKPITRENNNKEKEEKKNDHLLWKKETVQVDQGARQNGGGPNQRGKTLEERKKGRASRKKETGL